MRGQHLPGIGHIRGVGPGEAAAGDEFWAHAQQSRLPRLIEVQAACLVARLDAEGIETALGQQVLLVGVEAHLLAALGRVEVEVDRQLALADQGKAAAAAGAIGGLPGRIDAKHAHRRDQEAGRGRQPDGQGAAAGVAGRIAERHAKQVASTAGHRRPGRAAAELQVDQRQQRQPAPASPPRRRPRLVPLRPAARSRRMTAGTRARRRRKTGRKGEGGEKGEGGRCSLICRLRFSAFLPFSPASLPPLPPSPANNRRGAIRPMRRTASQIAARAIRGRWRNRSAGLCQETCSVRNGVPMAGSHQVRSPKSMSAA